MFLPEACRLFDVTKDARQHIQYKFTIKIRKQFLMEDVLDSYQQTPDLEKHNLCVVFDDKQVTTSGDSVNEAALMFSLFWQQITEKHFTGNDEVVPVVDSMVDEELFCVLGRIIWHGFVLFDFWPVVISQAVSSFILTGFCSDRNLLCWFHSVLTDPEREIIARAKMEIKEHKDRLSSSTLKDIVIALRKYGNIGQISTLNFDLHLKALARYHFLRKPHWALTQLREGFVTNFECVSSFNPSEIEVINMHSALTSKPLNLINKIKFKFSKCNIESTMTEEHLVEQFLQNYIMKLNQEQLTNLIMNWCHFSCLCLSELIVKFKTGYVSLQPRFHPNYAIMEVSSTYSSQKEFDQLLNFELNGNSYKTIDLDRTCNL